MSVSLPPAPAAPPVALPLRAPRDRGWAVERALWIAALLLLAFAFQGSRGLWDPDEGRYAAVAVDMVRSGDWFTPHLGSRVPHFTKPPLTYWLLAVPVALLGVDEWTLRLPVALAFVATVLVVRRLARSLAPGRELLAAAVYATSLLPFVAANLVTTDTFLALFEALGMLGYVLAGDPARERPGLAPLVFWSGFGLAFLTKGPPGLLPLLAVVAHLLWTRDRPRARRLASIAGILLFAALAFGWYAAQLHARPDLLGYLLGKEVEERVTGVQHRNPGLAGVLKVYLPTALLGLLPWNVLLLRRRRGSDDRAAGARSADRLVGAWIALPLAVFCLAQSRLPLYLLPLAVPAALGVARRLPRDLLASRRARAALAAWGLGLVALKGYAALRPAEEDGRALARAVGELVRHRPKELAIVDHEPLWSLGVYLRCEVASVELEKDLVWREGPSYRPLTRTLDQQLRGGRHPTVFLVTMFSEVALQQDLARAGWRFARRGEVPGFAVYTASPGRSDGDHPRRRRLPRSPFRPPIPIGPQSPWAPPKHVG